VHAQTRVTVVAGQVENMSLKRKLHAEYPKAQREWPAEKMRNMHAKRSFLVKPPGRSGRPRQPRVMCRSGSKLGAAGCGLGWRFELCSNIPYR
jgi:hypothetical protein